MEELCCRRRLRKQGEHRNQLLVVARSTSVAVPLYARKTALANVIKAAKLGVGSPDQNISIATSAIVRDLQEQYAKVEKNQRRTQRRKTA